MTSILITGGAGFIGSNAADHYLKKGDKVYIFDNFSRNGTDSNVAWLKKNHGDNLEVYRNDICTDFDVLRELMEKVDIVLHFAAQVAVTTSVTNPREDFEINALGTFNVLEAIRLSDRRPMIIYSSTNKVYGGMEDILTHEINGRYEYKDLPNGISEDRLLDFHSPYGCSKGAADQYVRDYSRIYGLKTVVFRQSCIYGYRQFGIEDQGWVAWFTIATLFDKPITIYGDGKQVRDVLFIDDLINAYDMAVENIDKTSGRVYNIGGGSSNQMSLLELIAHLEKYYEKKIDFTYSDWRPGDQPVFVCDIGKAKKEFGWEPRVSVAEGTEKLAMWIKENKILFKDM
ncbi:GDP-mannose 4,6-dehydratase [Patescibacteria group bacterium]|nr:GDP-mannose 4,6-dehydratase [Patescibacteria group bacterium]